MSKPHPTPTTVAEVATLLKSPKISEFVAAVGVVVSTISLVRDQFGAQQVIDVAEQFGIYPECSEHCIHPATPACLVDHFLGVYETLTSEPLPPVNPDILEELGMIEGD